MVRTGVATSAKTATSSTPAVELEKRTTHAFESPLDPFVLVDGIEVRDDSVDSKCALHKPPVNDALRVDALTGTDVEVTTPTPPARVQGPPETDEVAGWATAAASEKVSPAPEPPPAPEDPDPFVWNGPVWVAYRPPSTAATTMARTTASTSPGLITGFGTVGDGGEAPTDAGTGGE